MLAAGDLYRLLERFEQAGALLREAPASSRRRPRCSRAPAIAQRAGQNYERCGRFADAAECLANCGRAPSARPSCSRAPGRSCAPAEIQLANGLDDDAIKVLQEVAPEHADFAQGLGAARRDLPQARQALARDQEAHARDRQRGRRRATTCRRFYSLATVYEANRRDRRRPPSSTRRSSPSTTTTRTSSARLEARARAAEEAGRREAGRGADRRAAQRVTEAGPLQDRRQARPRRDGRRLQGAGHRARPHRRLQGAARHAEGEPAGAQELPARGQERRAAQPPEHRDGLRRRRAGRRATTSRWSTSTATR